MKNNSIRLNFLYNFILTSANYIFPLLTFPYVSRVLGVTNIGICNWIDGIIYYFILFSMMGIGIIGIRETAKAKRDKCKLNNVFSSLFVINSLLTFLAVSILVISIFYVPQFYSHKELVFIGVLKLIFNYLQIEWLYKGLEDFKYITNRIIIVKCIFKLVV